MAAISKPLNFSKYPAVPTQIGAALGNYQPFPVETPGGFGDAVATAINALKTNGSSIDPGFAQPNIGQALGEKAAALNANAQPSPEAQAINSAGLTQADADMIRSQGFPVYSDKSILGNIANKFHSWGPDWQNVLKSKIDAQR